MSKFVSMIVAAALLASVATAAPVQDAKPKTDATPAKVRGQAGTRQTPAAGTKQVDTKKVDAKKIGTKQVDAKKGDAKETDTKQVDPKTAVNHPPRKGEGKELNREEMAKKLTLEEGKHRERLAKIARLRTLAEEKKQTERVAALDDLLAKENARHARWISEGQRVLGSEEFKRIDGKLQKGRRHPGKQGADRKPPIRAEDAGKPQKKDPAGKDGK